MAKLNWAYKEEKARQSARVDYEAKKADSIMSEEKERKFLDQIARLKTSLKDKEAEVIKLESQSIHQVTLIQDLTSQVTTLTSQLASKENVLKSLSQDVETHEKRATVLEKEVGSKDVVVEQFN